LRWSSNGLREQIVNTLRQVTDKVSASRWRRWALLLLIAASFALRSCDLAAKSLWTDEGLTVSRAEQPVGLVVKNQNLIPVEPNYYDGSEVEVVTTPDVHPPLYFLLTHFWMQIAGRSEFIIRFPSVLASTLVLPLLFALGSALLSKESGLWAVLLAAVSPFYTWHAQEARMYAWVILFAVTSVYAFLPLLRANTKSHQYLTYLMATSALLYTHYTGFLLLAFELVVYAIHQSRRGGRLRSTFVILVVMTLALIPLAPYIRRVLGLSFFGFVSRPLSVLVAEAWSYFSLGVSESLIRPFWQTAPFLALFAVGALMVDVPRRLEGWMVCLGHLALPLLLFHITSYFKPNYMNPRHLLVISPAWELVMAQGVTTLRRRFWPGLVLLLGLALCFRGRANYDIFSSHRLWKDDIRGAIDYIESRARPGDAIVLHDPVIRLTVDYYYDGPYPLTSIPGYGQDDEQEAIDQFAEWARRYERVWFLYGPPPAHFPEDALPDWADAHLFKVRQQAFEAIWTYVGVAAYDEEPPVVEALPSEARSRDIDWGALHLTGFQTQEVAQGNTGWLELYWQADESVPDEPLRLKVELLDGAGTVWYAREERVLPFYSPSVWPPERNVRTDFRLPLPADLPPITYRVRVAPVGLGDSQVVGEVQVVRPNESFSAPPPSARFENGMVLLESELGSNVFRAGNPLFGSLVWGATDPIDDDYDVRVRLTDLRGRELIIEEVIPSAAGFPTSEWVPGDRVAGRFVLPLPIDLADGHYRVEISLVDDFTGQVLPVRRWYGKREWLSLGTVRVEAWPIMKEVPDGIDQPLERVEIAEGVRLRGYDLTQEDDTLRLTLYWQAQSPVQQNYHVFVHVGLPDEPPLAVAGGIPVDWTRPTTSWRDGEVIADAHVVSLTNVPPGHYELAVGFYDPESGQRPKTVVNGDVVAGGYVVLEELEVE